MPVNPALIQAILTQRTPDIVGAFRRGRDASQQAKTRGLMGDVLSKKYADDPQMAALARQSPAAALGLSKATGEEKARQAALAKLTGETTAQAMETLASGIVMVGSLTNNMPLAISTALDIANKMEATGGSANTINKFRQWAESAKKDPETAGKNMRLLSSAARNAYPNLRVDETPGFTPTTEDRFVERANAESIRTTGKPLTPGEKNRAALQHRRIQAAEAGDVETARREAQASTEERIKYSGKLGERLAEIATAADLMDAKGEVPENEVRSIAKKRMEGNISKLVHHYWRLNELGAITNIEKTSIQNLAASLKSSPAGQAAGRMFGTTAQSVRQTINNLKPLIISDIKKSTGMSSRDMDSNRELQFYLQAVTNERSDIQSNMAALAVLSRAFGDGTIALEIDELMDQKALNRITKKGLKFRKMDQARIAKKQRKPGKMPTEDLSNFNPESLL